jgi:HSP20 family protein
MSLMKREQVRAWDPFRDLEDMSARLNRLFTRPFAGEGIARGSDWAPSMNISETPKAYVIAAELPGVKKEDVQVSLESGILTIAGERKQESRDEKLHRIESSYGSFLRRVAMPEDARTEEVEATYKDGMLTVKIGKQSPEERPSAKQIPIN